MSRSNNAVFSANAITPEARLTAAVAPAGTFALSYPANYTVDDFTLDSARHVLGVGANPGSKRYYEGADFFTLAFNAADITVTWRDTTTIPAGSYAKLQLDCVGAANDDSVELVLPSQVRRQHTVELDLGKPDTANASYFRAAAAIGGAGNLALLQTVLDVPRNLTFTHAANDAARLWTITGKDEYGVAMIETLAGGNTATVAGKKAFKTITTINFDGASAGNVNVGFGDVIGLPLWLPSTAHVLKEFQDGGVAAAGTIVAGLARATVSGAQTADVRGTLDPNAACSGAIHFSLLVSVDDPTYKGNQQYDG